MPEKPRDEILRLRAEVARHEDLYRRKHAPEISDYEFDQIRDRLQELEAAHPDLAGPDLGIGDDRSEGFEQRDHAEPMLSLDNTYKREQFAAFV
ncbi:MAG: DNA ligase LigA-related protein, partial [Opitutia bacterium]